VFFLRLGGIYPPGMVCRLFPFAQSVAG